MLRFPKNRYNWFGKAQSGFFIDFVVKKFTEVFLRNVLISGALFFGEKYIIEKLTKKVVDNFIFNSNKYLGLSNLNHGHFFYLSMSLILYSLLCINIIILF